MGGRNTREDVLILTPESPGHDAQAARGHVISQQGILHPIGQERALGERRSRPVCRFNNSADDKKSSRLQVSC